jgi:hypothetical protein
MITPAEEDYVHFAESCERLNRAWRILQELRASDAKPAIYDAAFRFALIEYATPYNRSDGIHRRKRDAYRLKPLNFSPEELALHDQILALRDQVLAHSDLTIKDAIVSLGRYRGRANICIAQNTAPLLPDLTAVIRLIEHSLDMMYVKKAELLESLGPKT